MKIADIVKNSIWYDPRVRKQLAEYTRRHENVVAVGITDVRYNREAVEILPCRAVLVPYNNTAGQNFFRKILREVSSNKSIYKAIVREKPDISHANDLNALIPAYMAARRLKCALIYDTHEIFLENPWISGNKPVKLIWSVFERYIIKRVDLVVCVSHAAADYFKRKYKIQKPVVITNCIAAGSRVQDIARESIFPKQVLNQGQFYAGRGYDIMIEAAAMLSSCNDLQFVLRGYGELEDQLKRRAAELNTANVYFAPPVNIEELIPCASRAWVGLAITEKISLNFELSVSNKIFEYAAAGIPVIMSDIPEHRYLNDKYHFGIVLREDSSGCLASAIMRLYKDRTLYRTCAENSKKLSCEITWENEFGKLIEFERKLTVK